MSRHEEARSGKEEMETRARKPSSPRQEDIDKKHETVDKRNLTRYSDSSNQFVICDRKEEDKKSQAWSFWQERDKDKTEGRQDRRPGDTAATIRKGRNGMGGRDKIAGDIPCLNKRSKNIIKLSHTSTMSPGKKNLNSNILKVLYSRK